ncbi:glycosyltransferase family 1 protein [bacterium M00.F.Ca.ET.230.01.1.1]|nr:glycosyltransferase family 1 protein [bacterium M00.F.Ca.ET.230.01.1.1]
MPVCQMSNIVSLPDAPAHLCSKPRSPANRVCGTVGGKPCSVRRGQASHFCKLPSAVNSRYGWPPALFALSICWAGARLLCPVTLREKYRSAGSDPANRHLTVMTFNSKKIDRVIFTESSPDIGGQERQLLIQMRSLLASGTDVVLACRPDSRVGALATTMNIQTVTLPFRNSADPRTIIGLYRLIAAMRPAACFCHSGHDTNNLAIAARIFGRNRPRLIRSKAYLVGKISEYSYNYFVDVTFAPSKYLRSRILSNSRVDPKRVEVIYPGVDFEKLDAECHLDLPSDLSHWIERKRGALIVQVGMLRGEKGHLLMLDAISKVRSRWPALHFAIVGSGPEQESIKQRAIELGLYDQIWMGELPSVAAILKKADLVVMPSVVEALGQAQIEAAGLGIPIVASNIGGIPETISHLETGLLAEPNANDFAQWLDYALSHPDDMRMMAHRAQADVRSRFSIENNASALKSLITRQVR